MNIYQTHGTINLGWYTKEETYKVTEHLHAMVYSFAFCKNKPNKDVFPHEIRETFYVGQSGTEEGKHLSYDQKNRIDMGSYKARKYGRYYTMTKLRMKDHWRQFEKQRENQENKYKIFHEHFTPLLRKDEQVFCNIMIPDSSKSSSVKSWLFMVEAMVIHCYDDKFKGAPLCNLANQTGVFNRSDDSISNMIVTSNERSNLDKFLNGEYA